MRNAARRTTLLSAIAVLIALPIFGFMAVAQSIVPAQAGDSPTPTIWATCVAPQLDDGTWVERNSMPTPRSEMAAAVLDELIYVPGGFGGTDIFEVYDSAADEWQELAALPDGRNHLMVTALDGYVYVFGGGRGDTSEPTDTAWQYDPDADTWTELTPMPEPRYAGAAVTLDDYIYIVGGIGETQALLRYDPAQDEWATLAELQEPREHLAAAALDGVIYALAGRWNGEVTTSVEMYDATTDTWEVGIPMQEARSGFGAAVIGEHLLVAGGEVFQPMEALTRVEAFHPTLGYWTALPELPSGIHGNPVASVGRSLFILGGSDRAMGIDNHGRVLMYTVP
jgi:N-acetylneuraminic acid mutarotase